MKFFETHFEEYIKEVERDNLHKELINPIKKNITKNINDLQNIIFYGPSGVGKYSQALNVIKNYSDYNLKYEKKISIEHNKTEYFLKISDIHYEVDMSLLGCNAKILWNDIYHQILNIISTKKDKKGIILCKNFHLIHNELLELFYSYVQKQLNNNIIIKYIFTTESISFIPQSIYSSCKTISIGRPIKSKYNNVFNIKIDKNIKLKTIVNIKSLKNDNLEITNKDKVTIISQKIIDYIFNNNSNDFLYIRDVLYDIFINNIQVDVCIWKILFLLFEKQSFSSNIEYEILMNTYIFLKLYNNNYRPIYHLENFVFFIIRKVYEQKKSM